ncbi:MAG: ribonuclease HI family protein [Candidatus Paceibacterota bacterium]|jgi:ribonuclease HI
MVVQKLIIYTDGASRNNQVKDKAVAGAGAYITDADGKVLKECTEYLGNQTNNFAEYQAIILGLTEAKKIVGAAAKDTHLDVRMDSELAVRQLNGLYRVKHPVLREQFDRVMTIASHFPHITFTHVPREKNKEADRLSNEAIDNHKA